MNRPLPEFKHEFFGILSISSVVDSCSSSDCAGSSVSTGSAVVDVVSDCEVVVLVEVDVVVVVITLGTSGSGSGFVEVEFVSVESTSGTVELGEGFTTCSGKFLAGVLHKSVSQQV